jgi:hypothetical protein
MSQDEGECSTSLTRPLGTNTPLPFTAVDTAWHTYFRRIPITTHLMLTIKVTSVVWSTSTTVVALESRTQWVANEWEG